jgi:hypothetical protein
VNAIAFGPRVHLVVALYFRYHFLSRKAHPMQVDRAASRPRASVFSVFRLDRLSSFSLHLPSAKPLMIAALLALSLFPTSGYGVRPAQPGLEKLFHLVGIPGLRRDERVDLTLDAEGLSFQTKKAQYQVPYARLRHVLMLSSDRRYEGRTYAAALATYGVGALLILKKHHVETVVLDYVNEREGKMGIVLQMEISQGEVFRNQLKSRGVSIDEPEALSESLPKPQTGTDNTEGSKH